MSGWIDWHRDDVECPFCKETISILFVEEGSSEPFTSVTISIASGKAECPECHKTITDSILITNGGKNETV